MPDPNVEMIDVDSTNLSRVGYSATSRRLYVEFQRGGGGYHENVPPDVFDSLMGPSSKGSFYYHNIRGVYPYVKE